MWYAIAAFMMFIAFVILLAVGASMRLSGRLSEMEREEALTAQLAEQLERDLSQAA